MDQNEAKFSGEKSFLNKILFLIVVFFIAHLPVIASTFMATGTDFQSNKHQEFNLGNKKDTVVIFMSSKCPCSKSQAQYIKALAANPKYKNFEFLGVNSNKDESFKFAQKYFQKENFPFMVIKDQDQTMANELGALKTPHVFIIDKNQEIIYQGGIINSRTPQKSDLKHYLREALDDINKEIKPRVAKTRTLGCRIKR